MSTRAAPRRWLEPLAVAGVILAVIAAGQVVSTVVVGLTVHADQTQGTTTDVLHRMGYAFSGLGTTTVLLYLLVAVLLVSLPEILQAPRSGVGAGSDRAVTVTTWLAVVLALLLVAGSLLAVRYNLHAGSTPGHSAPTYYKFQLVTFLLGALGPAAVVVGAALTSIRLRAGSAAVGSAAAASAASEVDVTPPS